MILQVVRLRLSATFADQGHVAHFRYNGLHDRGPTGPVSDVLRLSRALLAVQTAYPMETVEAIMDASVGAECQLTEKSRCLEHESAVFSCSHYSAARGAPDQHQHVDERIRRNSIQISLNEQSISSSDLPDSKDVIEKKIDSSRTP